MVLSVFLVFLLAMTVVNPAVAESKAVTRETYDVSVDDTVYVNVQHTYKEKAEHRGAVLMVHGIWHTSFFYHYEDSSEYSIMEYLATRNYDCFALDLRGSGDSCKGDYEWYSQISLYDYVEDVRTVVADIQEEHGYEKVALIGHSMGGMVAVMYAAEYPETLQSLVVIGTMYQEFGIPDQTLEEFRYAAQNYPVIPCDPALIQPFFFAEGQVEEEVLDKATNVITQELFGSTAALQVLDLIFAEKVDDIDEDIPVLLLKGELDALAPNNDAEDFLDALDCDDKELIIFENHGHDILLEKKPKKVYKEIYQWLKAHN